MILSAHLEEIMSFINLIEPMYLFVESAWYVLMIARLSYVLEGLWSVKEIATIKQY